MVCQQFTNKTWSVKGERYIMADFIGNWKCEERQIYFRFPCIIMSKKENVNQQLTNRDANKAATWNVCYIVAMEIPNGGKLIQFSDDSKSL